MLLLYVVLLAPPCASGELIVPSRCTAVVPGSEVGWIEVMSTNSVYER